MNPKKTAAAALLGLALASNTVQAGNLAEPLVSPEVIEAETTNSAGGFIIPLVLLAVLVAVISSSGGGSGAAPAAGGLR
ncbi:hypothetical protein N9L47_07555 [Rhodobacteraceae bacterium]|nr:hypothetical protein [Paracoccaceae bacterium]